MLDLLHNILGPSLKAGGLVVLGLILIESLLSIDNAAVLATMVMDLKPRQRGRALRIGLFLGYIFRGVCLFIASWLIKITWLKGIGGLYLIWLSVDFFRGVFSIVTSDPDQPSKPEKKPNRLYRMTIGRLGPFWGTVLMVEIMDLVFSIDNVFAAAAYVEHYPEQYRMNLIVIGVFIGILAMRFVAQGFVKLMEAFPFLQKAAFIVIGILGIKLVISSLCVFAPDNALCVFFESHESGLYFSVFTLCIFIIPIFTSLLLDFPRRY